MEPITAELVTLRDMATILGIDQRTVRNLRAQGIIPRDSSTGRYPLVMAVRAYIAHRLGKAARADEEALDYNRERARLTFEQANRAALRYRREAAQLVEADAAQLALEHVLVPVRQYFQEQGDRLAPGLVGLQVHEIKAALDRENVRELGRLANPVLEFTGSVADPELDVLSEDPDGGEPPVRAGNPPGVENTGAAED